MASIEKSVAIKEFLTKVSEDIRKEFDSYPKNRNGWEKADLLYRLNVIRQLYHYESLHPFP